MKVVAVIPARAGSKGVPNKNTRIVAGHPLWKWTYWAALMAESVNEIIITTDIKEILESPLAATIIQRPAELATDDASLDSAVIHATEGFDGLVVVLQPTVPLRPRGLIDACIDVFLEIDGMGHHPGGMFNSLVTVNALHVVWRGGREGYGPALMAPRVERQKMRAEDTFYHEDGSVFIVHSTDLHAAGSRVVDPVLLFCNERTVDIDTENDLALAGILIKSLKTYNKGEI